MNFLKNFSIVAVVVAIAVGVRYYVFDPSTVSGESMNPVLVDGDFVLISKLSNIERFDIVSAKDPDNTKVLIVKRVIGLPGDHIVFKDDKLTVNGKYYDEPYLQTIQRALRNQQLVGRYGYTDNGVAEYLQKVTQFTHDLDVFVPADSYFLMGDNRLLSKDSRIFGPVFKSDIIGKMLYNFH